MAGGRSRTLNRIAASWSGIATMAAWWENRSERGRFLVRCAVEIDPHNQSFQLVPLPGELEKALEAAQDSIGKRLSDELAGIGIFAGRP